MQIHKLVLLLCFAPFFAFADEVVSGTPPSLPIPMADRPSEGLSSCSGSHDYADNTVPSKSWSPKYDTWMSNAVSSSNVPTGEILKADSARKDTPITLRNGIKDILINGQGPTGFPKDIKRICPNFASMTGQQRATFYDRFAESVSYAESVMTPTSVYHEAYGDKTYGYSVGLLQMSTEDNYEWGCNFVGPNGSKPDSCAPTNQMQSLNCFAEVLAIQVSVCGTLFQGLSTSTGCHNRTEGSYGGNGSFYFSTLNATKPGFKEFKSEWQKLTGFDFDSGKGGTTGALSFCYAQPPRTS